MLISYPAIFYYSPNEDGSYYVSFPDLAGNGTQGVNLEDALFMASDYLGIILADYIETESRLPERSDINELSIVGDFPFKDDEEFENYYDMDRSFVSMVAVDIDDYLGGNELVKKTLSIPKWSNNLGLKLGLNFSKVLTDAIERELFQ